MRFFKSFQVLSTVFAHTFQVQFQHSISTYSFNTHISSAVSNIHSSAVSTHTFQMQFRTYIQVQFQHTHFKRSFNTHISSAVSTHIFQVQFEHTHFRWGHLKHTLQHCDSLKHNNEILSKV